MRKTRNPKFSRERARPGGLLRALYRLPVPFFRAGLLGWQRFLGARWILVTTTGRKTGRPHRVLLDLLWEDGAYYVQAAYGPDADWVRNVEADPIVDAEVGGRRFRARVSGVAAAKSHEILLAYARAHPIYSRVVSRLLGYRGGLRSERELCDWLAKTFLTMVVRPQ